MSADRPGPGGLRASLPGMAELDRGKGGARPPGRVLASFAGAGILDAGRILAVLEALERRGAAYHRQLPAEAEVARDAVLEDRADPVGTPGATVRTIRMAWTPFHKEPELSTEGLAGLRARLPGLPDRWLGFRVRLAYAFRKDPHEPLELAFFQGSGEHYEVQASVGAGRFGPPAEARLARADALLLADLGEALWDVLAPAYGAIRPDAGVLPDEVPLTGWGYYGPVLVERAGRQGVEAFAARCLKAWELADKGWFLAPGPLGGTDPELEAWRESLFRPIRHLTLAGMRGKARVDG